MYAKEPFGVILIVGPASFHRCDAFVVKAIGTLTTLDLDVSFVERQFNGARGPFLRRVDKLKKLSLIHI